MDVNICNNLLKALFEPEDRRLDLCVQSLDSANREIRKHAKWGFMHMGQVFIPNNAPYKREGSYPPLDFSLSRQGNAFLKDVAQVSNDSQAIKQMMVLLLKPCTSLQEMRDALPETLTSMVPEFRGLTRLNDVAFTIRDDVRAMRQFNKLLDKIDFYVATQFIY